MHCSNSYGHLKDDWRFCASCGKERDKKGGLEKEDVIAMMDARTDTIQVLQEIINDLEFYGKMQTSSSMVSSGAKIASGVLWLVAPSNPFTVAADMTASGLSLVDIGVSVFTEWKESGLLSRAAEICKRDFDMPKKFPHGKAVLEHGKPEEYKYKLSEGEAYMSILANLSVFISNCIKIYNGNYSSVAAELKLHLQGLQDEYDCLKKLA